MVWLRGMIVGALVATMSPVSIAQGVANQKIGPCGGAGAALSPGQIVSAIALSTLGQDYISSQSNDETLLMTQCAAGISLAICTNEPINDLIGGPAIVDHIITDTRKGAVIGGVLGLMTGSTSRAKSGAATGAMAGSVWGAGSSILSVAQCGKERDALLSIARRAQLDWRIYAKPRHFESGQLAAKDFDNQLTAAVRRGSISQADSVEMTKMFTKWANWLLPQG